MEPGYAPIDHTADVGIVARGRTLAELFEQAALGLMDIVCDRRSVEPRHTRAIEASASPGDREALLVAWLDEINFHMQVEAEVYHDARVHALERETGRVRGIVRGESLDPQRHRLDTEVKGVTWHALEVREAQGGFTARVIFDV